jgi:hypothetical protein
MLGFFRDTEAILCSRQVRCGISLLNEEYQKWPVESNRVRTVFPFGKYYIFFKISLRGRVEWPIVRKGTTLFDSSDAS